MAEGGLNSTGPVNENKGRNEPFWYKCTFVSIFIKKKKKTTLFDDFDFYDMRNENKLL